MENKIHPAATGSEKKGGYPAGDNKPGQGKPPPSSISKPAPAKK
jgi:hypothetical protein